MAVRSSLFFLVLALVGAFSTPGPHAGEHPSARPGGLPEEHPDISQIEMSGDHPGAPAFEVNVVEIPFFLIAVAKGTLGGDVSGLFETMFDAVNAQGLFNEETEVGAAFPFAMAKGWDENTVIWAGVNLPDDRDVATPLEIEEIGGGEYLMVVHVGPYEETEPTWVAAFAWAEEHGIKFSDGIAMEHYLDDPSNVAPEDLHTEIYIPLVAGQSHEGMDYSQYGGHAEQAGHGNAPGEHSAPALEVEVVELPSLRGAVLEGTLRSDIDALFSAMFDAVRAQGLFNADTEVGAVFPFAMASGWDDDSVILVGVSLSENAVVSDPLTLYETPAGEYLMVMHYGPYETTEKTWKAVYAWAGKHGIKFGTGPAMEHYLDNPEEVAAEDLRTEIYIPLVPDQGHEGMDFSQKTLHAEPRFDVDIMQIPEGVQAAYIAGTLAGDMHGLFMGMIDEAMAQGLMLEDTKVGAIYPTVMAGGYHGEDTVVYAAISFPEGAEVVEPFSIFDIPAGEYLVVEHVGPYEESGETWEAVFMWAEGHGVKFGDGAAMEHYLNDPAITPPEELVTQIIIPLLPGQKHPDGHGDAAHGGQGEEHPSGAEHPSGSEHPIGGGNEHPH